MRAAFASRVTVVTCQSPCFAVRPCSVSTCPVLVPPTNARWSRSSQIDHASYQQKLTVIIQRLKKHLSCQKWPRLTHLDFAGGLRFELPMSKKDVDAHLSHLGRVDMAYLAGFFDGDGCVVPQSNLSGCTLALEQSVTNSSVLFLFLANFGGSIRRAATGLGSVRPKAQWYVGGALARAAAVRLRPHCLVKREQLRIAMAWPSSTSDREACYTRLKQLKRSPPNIASKAPICWTYVAGFFDAEGCILVPADSKNLRLVLWQRDPEILQAVQTFITKEFPDAVPRLYSRRLVTGHCLILSCGKATVLMVLKKLLEHGLRFKRPQALHLMTSNFSSHADMRQSGKLMKGNQSYLQRLDRDGCERSKQIRNLAERLRRYAQKKLVDMAVLERMQAELQAARLAHRVLNSQSQIQKLRAFIASIQSMHEETA
ncbi:unnamed protein product [Durusdinium trenchii]|uniref:Homing endonuclease LAGLIDADG domain-containing protein n=1 Tax=Durusdinium trenchii TaxID=1381693 RepID=A0ABP0K0K7_9DINO